MAAPTIRSSASTLGTDASPAFSVTLPASRVAGDLLLCFAGGDFTAAWTHTGSWTELVDFAGTNNRYGLYARLATNDANDNLSLTGSNNQDYVVYTVAIAGHGVVNVSTDLVIPTSATGNSAAANPPSAIGSVARDWLSFAVAIVDLTASGSSVSAIPANYTVQLLTKSASSNSSVGIGVARRDLTAATTEDPGAFTNTSGQWIAGTVLVPPPVPVDGVEAHSTSTSDIVSLSTPITYTELFEGGADAVPITNLNSIFNFTSGGPEFDTAVKYHGSTAMLIPSGSTAIYGRDEALSCTAGSMSFYARFDSVTPAGNYVIMQLRTSAGITLLTMSISTAGRLFLQDSANATITGTNVAAHTLTASNWYRIDLIWDCGATSTTGRVRYRIIDADPLDSDTPITTAFDSGATLNLGGGQIVDRLYIGGVLAGTARNGDYHFDTLRMATFRDTYFTQYDPQILPIESVSTSSSDNGTITASTHVDGVQSASATTSDVANILGPTVIIDGITAHSATVSDIPNTFTPGTIDPIDDLTASAGTGGQVILDWTGPEVIEDPIQAFSTSSSDVANITGGASIQGVDAISVTTSQVCDVTPPGVQLGPVVYNQNEIDAWAPTGNQYNRLIASSYCSNSRVITSYGSAITDTTAREALRRDALYAKCQAVAWAANGETARRNKVIEVLDAVKNVASWTGQTGQINLTAGWVTGNLCQAARIVGYADAAFDAFLRRLLRTISAPDNVGTGQAVLDWTSGVNWDAVFADGRIQIASYLNDFTLWNEAKDYLDFHIKQGIYHPTYDGSVIHPKTGANWPQAKTAGAHASLTANHWYNTVTAAPWTAERADVVGSQPFNTGSDGEATRDMSHQAMTLHAYVSALRTIRSVGDTVAQHIYDRVLAMASFSANRALYYINNGTLKPDGFQGTDSGGPIPGVGPGQYRWPWGHVRSYFGVDTPADVNTLCAHTNILTSDASGFDHLSAPLFADGLA